jgi:hypothetical protein
MIPNINEMGKKCSKKGWITILSVAVALPATGILCHRSWLPWGTGLGGHISDLCSQQNVGTWNSTPYTDTDTDSTSTNNVSAAWLRLSTQHSLSSYELQAEGRITHLLQYFTSCKRKNQPAVPPEGHHSLYFSA